MKNLWTNKCFRSQQTISKGKLSSKVSEEIEHEEGLQTLLQSEHTRTNLERNTIEIFEDEDETETNGFTMVQKDDYSVPVPLDEDEEMGNWDALDQDREMKQAPRASPSAELHTDCSFHRLVFLIYILMVGGGVAACVLFLLDDDETPQGTPTSAMDDINLDSCDFSDSAMPRDIDQCRCGGEITIIPIDVRHRYQLHLQDFISRLYQAYDEPIGSCTIRNQAL